MRGFRGGSFAFAILLAFACDSSINPNGVEKVATIGKLALTTKSVSLIVGEERQLSLAGNTYPATWQTDNADAVSVSPNGLLSARAPGVAHIIVRQQSSADTIVVTVRTGIDDVQILTDSVDIAVGQTAKLRFRVTDSAGAIIDGADFNGMPIRWSSSRPSIAAVDSLGLVSAAAIGQTVITLTIGDKADSAFVTTVPVAVANVVLSAPAQFSISVGSSYKITATAIDAAGNYLPGRAFAWSSSDPAVASVSQVGIVSGVAPGSAEISVLSEGQTAHVTIAVSPPPVASVTVSLASGVIDTGRTTQATAVARDAKGIVLTGRSVVWSSSNVAAATVSSSGIVRGIALGNAAITAVVEGVPGSATVKVDSLSNTPAPTVATVSVAVSPASLSVGQTASAIATPRDSSGNVVAGRTIAWNSSQPGIAMISTTGTVTAISSGTATITAVTDGKSGAVSVNVTAPVTTPSPASGTLATHDFEDGTLGPYYNPWGSGIDVVPDPTGRGGKVSRIHYAAASLDDNKAMMPKAPISVGLGDSIFFRGQFYLPPEINTDPNFGLRKLTYWSNRTFKEEFSAIITLVGEQLVVVNTVVGPSNLPIDFQYTPTMVSKGVWHTLETQIKVNSSFAAKDGVFRIWLDGALVYNRTDMRWSDPLWTEDPGAYKWEIWGIGYQVNSRSAFDEYRYWDNITFAKTRITP
jgi:uncharacterized protein YjdB